MPIILSINVQRALDINGTAVPGARAFFYNSGTTARRIVYSDPACNFPHPQPLLADGAGVFPQIYDIGGGDAAVLLTDAAGNTLAGYPVDPVPRVDTDETGASSVEFSPTAQIPVTNVQAAIERVQTNIVAPLAEFGLGVTGTAPLLANLNATNIATGFYRYNADTTGTRPAGVPQEGSGTVNFMRQDGNNGQMLLSPALDNRIHTRGLIAGTYSAWVSVMRSNDTTTNEGWIAGTSTSPTVPTPAAIRAAIVSRSVGENQSWVDVLPNRVAGTSYQNTTGRAIVVAVSGDGNPAQMQVSANGTAWVNVGRFGEAGAVQMTVSFVVPAGHFYRTVGSISLLYWSELR